MRTATTILPRYQHLQINKKMTNEVAILQHLPERLRAEVAVSVHLPTLRRVQIFQNCEASLLEELVLKLQPQTPLLLTHLLQKWEMALEGSSLREVTFSVQMLSFPPLNRCHLPLVIKNEQSIRRDDHQSS